ncbi:hypothetical protein K7X08_008774 [Anisodus acutangulus]|uniref:Uncharacterized protein n=1 Tax=Anisodus acutangulus TaxID=402998 RepID=A0A9Q1N1N5_9SOLA|nr:hypothetical protein K7X08_008774 [Anisodus acutangulus]
MSSSQSQGSTGTWTAKQNKAFEKALAVYDMDTPDQWWCALPQLQRPLIKDVNLWLQRSNEAKKDATLIKLRLLHSNCLQESNPTTSYR